ncbi:MAG TPA: Bax inhibitor-1/YccA family protein [Acidimicrobiia bacterium]|nr:Bax inhibitor-1/YccA family protein [Acidimicrobiia bacterium]
MANPVLEKQFGTASADVALQTAQPPPATGADTMSMGSVITSTLVLLILVMGGAAFGWANAAAVQRWYWAFIIGLIVLVIATVARPQLAPITGIIYSLGQGAMLGSISQVYETCYDGIVLQAFLATMAVFVSMLFLYATRIVKVTQKLRSVIIIATVGIALFYLFSWILTLFNVDVPVLSGAGTPALIFSILVVFVAALNLLLDFQVIEIVVRNCAPRSFSWFAAFGLMVTIVWLYIEMLRLLAILARNR